MVWTSHVKELAHEPLQNIELRVVNELIIANVESIPMEHVGDFEITGDVIFFQKGLLEQVAADERPGFDSVFANERLEGFLFRAVFEDEGQDERGHAGTVENDEVVSITAAHLMKAAVIPVSNLDETVELGQLRQTKDGIELGVAKIETVGEKEKLKVDIRYCAARMAGWYFSGSSRARPCERLRTLSL